MTTSHTSFVDNRYSTLNHINGNQYNSAQYSFDSLQKLRPVIMDASRRNSCLKDTRADILKFVGDWVHDTASQHNILWVHGLAGSGKSALSTTIADMFREAGQLGAFLFFDRDVTERSDPTVVIRTMAHQLGASNTAFSVLIGDAVDGNSNITLSPISRQFQKLIIDVFQNVDMGPTPIVIVMDALDECGTPAEREALLAVLSEQFVQLPAGIRAIITSRADIDICDSFEDSPHILPYELDITSEANSSDILSYFQHRMTGIRKKKRRLHFTEGWPGDDSFHELVLRASGLFVWAFTASEFVDGHDPIRRLGLILRGEAASGAEAALDTLYKTALESVGHWDDDDFVNDFRAIFGIVLVARQPLSSLAIDAILQFPKERTSTYTTSLLGCVIQQSPTLRVLHPSFADFLTTKERCGRKEWYFHQPTHHKSLAFLCLDRMDGALKHNMCNISLSTEPGTPSLSEDLSYACVFWVEHVCLVEDNESVAVILDRLEKFLFRHLLHWFEAMSLVKRSRDTVKILKPLIPWLSVQPDFRENLTTLVQDALRFAQVFSDCIQEHPLLIYQSALPFTPIHTTLYKTFHDYNLHPCLTGGPEKSWSPMLLLLKNHTEMISSVSYSVDNSRIVSGSLDGTVRVWDAASGAQLLPAFMGHGGSVNSAVFSPDGKRIISGSDDGRIRVWDATLGTEVVPALRGHNAPVRSVVISPDGSRIASASYDETVRLWDSSTGAEIHPTLRGHSERVRTVAFSPDGKRLVSGSADATIRVWDVATGAQVYVIRRKLTSTVWCVTYSPDGTRIISGWSDGTIHTWDADTCTEIAPVLRIPNDAIWSLAISADGTRIVSGSKDKIVRIWDAASGDEVMTIQGHESSVMSVAYSPDGSHIASGSGDKTIRVWDATSSSDSDPLDKSQRLGGDSFRRSSANSGNAVISLRFSADGTRLISTSVDRTVRTRDTITGDILKGRDVFIPNIADPSQRICISPSGWIIDLENKQRLSKLPSFVRNHCAAAHSLSMLAIGTVDGQCLVIHFPSVREELSSKAGTTREEWTKLKGDELRSEEEVRIQTLRYEQLRKEEELMRVKKHREESQRVEEEMQAMAEEKARRHGMTIEAQYMEMKNRLNRRKEESASATTELTEEEHMLRKAWRLEIRRRQKLEKKRERETQKSLSRQSDEIESDDSGSSPVEAKKPKVVLRGIHGEDISDVGAVWS